MVQSASKLPWSETRRRLDERNVFENMCDTPYYRDAHWAGFSAQEYQRRYRELRKKMRELKLDCMIVPGGPSCWSFGGGMQWLSGHREWHGVAAYVIVPLEGDPTLVYAMGGTHLEATRREVAGVIADVRHSNHGRYGEVIVGRLKELGLEAGRIGLMEIDLRNGDYMPANQYLVMTKELPKAEFVFTRALLHELVSIHSAEELDAVRYAGTLCTRAMEAIRDRARPGVTEYQLAATAGHAMMDGGGEIVFLIIGSSPMSNPALFFGNPRPSSRELAPGDIIIMEIAAGYKGFSAQIGQPICIGDPPTEIRRFWDEIALPGYKRMTDCIGPGRPISELQEAGKFFRNNGHQSRPIHVHGMDFHTDKPFVFAETVVAEQFEQIMRPGMVLMPEPNPISADGMFGMFVGHTYIVTETGSECVDQWPLELTVVK